MGGQITIRNFFYCLVGKFWGTDFIDIINMYYICQIYSQEKPKFLLCKAKTSNGIFFFLNTEFQQEMYWILKSQRLLDSNSYRSCMNPGSISLEIDLEQIS